KVLELAPRLSPTAQYGHLLPPPVAANGFLAQAQAEQGAFEAAIVDAQAALGLAEALSQPFAIAMASHSLGFVHRRRGNLHEARVVLQRGLSVAQEWRLEFWLAMISWQLGSVQAQTGNEAGLEDLKDALGRFEARGIGGFRSLVMIDL